MMPICNISPINLCISPRVVLYPLFFLAWRLEGRSLLMISIAWLLVFSTITSKSSSVRKMLKKSSGLASASICSKRPGFSVNRNVNGSFGSLLHLNTSSSSTCSDNSSAPGFFGLPRFVLLIEHEASSFVDVLRSTEAPLPLELELLPIHFLYPLHLPLHCRFLLLETLLL